MTISLKQLIFTLQGDLNNIFLFCNKLSDSGNFKGNSFNITMAIKISTFICVVRYIKKKFFDVGTN